ncbi:MAG: endonuclease/exonuclease/phosphatase family protein, partial [Anaerolineae bacterium]|nr:endonuclease/exonuclease/phosphatase family protein [Anaerolineae bacterium]
MNRMIKNTCTTVAFLYAGLIASWFILHAIFGDSVWWLALLNAFAPILFLPLVAFAPACLICRQRAFRAILSVPLLIFVTLYGQLFLPVRPAAFASGEAPLTIMTFNIWGNSRTVDTARVIADHGLPDIVAIQELSPQMSEILMQEIGEAYPYHVLNLDEEHRGMGVFSHYPLAALDASHLSHPDWQIQAVRVETGNGPITLYNVHPVATNVMLYYERGESIAERVQASFKVRR